MRRCISCGRRWRGPHASCAVDPAVVGERTDPAPPIVPGYAVDRLLGSGGFATVWAASRTGDRAAVAIKVASQATEGARLAAERDALRADLVRSRLSAGTN